MSRKSSQARGGNWHPGSSTPKTSKETEPRETYPGHTVITSLNVKDKERILKLAEEKRGVIHKGALIIRSDLSEEIHQARGLG